jgi:hypothetical protein
MFTSNEKIILNNLRGFNYICRDRADNLMLFENEPVRCAATWGAMGGKVADMSIYKHLFKCIRWRDKEPCEFKQYTMEVDFNEDK